MRAQSALTNTKSSLQITSFNSRNFALFQPKTTAQQREQQQQAARQQQEAKPKDFNDIVRSIEQSNRRIAEKTRAGRELSKQIAKDVEPDKYVKMQRYEIFINKMEQLYRNELRYRKKQTLKFHQMQQAHVYSQQPLKDVLRFYNELSVRGFESSSIVESLRQVSKALRGRGQKARVMNDYSVVELDKSWRMQKLVDDVKFGLRGDQYFNPVHLAQTSELLGEIGYKNTELMPLFFDKLEAMVEEMYTGVKQTKEFTFDDAVYGGFKNQMARHYIFQGFQSSEEFNQHLTTLLEWEAEAETTYITSYQQQEIGVLGAGGQESVLGPQEKTVNEMDEEAAEFEQAVQEVIEAAVQVKEFQKDYQSSIDSLRQQYFKMQDASDKYQFLVDNPYIKYDLLELQELLVNAGYIDINEKPAAILAETTDDRMQRAANVFYDYVLNYQPEMLSPQHEHFYQIATSSSSSDGKERTKEKQQLNEPQTFLSLRTLSQTLSGLQQQALSYRRDTEERDYLHQFYEKYLLPLEQNAAKETLEKIKNPYIMMEREYLKAWKIFKEQSAQFYPVLVDLVNNYDYSGQSSSGGGDIEGQLYALQGLSAIRFESKEIREKIADNILKTFEANSNQQISQEALIEGLKGLAQGGSRVNRQDDLVERLRSKLLINNLDFKQQLDTLWALSLLGYVNSAEAQSIVNNFNKLSFERIDHDMPYEEYLQLLDIHNALKYESTATTAQFTNKRLLLAVNGEQFVLHAKYPEHSTHFDPFKKRVVQAITKGLTEAAINHQMLMESDLYNQQKGDVQYFHQGQYPYQPDIVMGYKGKKVALFVLPERQVFKDTYKADGVQQFRQRILQKASNDNVQTAALAVTQVVNYDIEQMQVNLNTSFNLQEELDSQLEQSSVGTPITKEIDFNDISQFGASMMKQAVDFSEKLVSQKDLVKFDTFIKQLLTVFQMKQQVELRYDANQKNVGFDNLKVNLMKLNLMYDNLSQETQTFLQKFLPSQLSFKQMLMNTKDSIKSLEVKEIENNNISSSWIGTRMEVELPISQKEMQKKSIIPEIINQRFMWVDDYFHYADWKQKQQETYDNFNLLVIPRHKDTPKFFFDKQSQQRIVPQGIFPFPNYKRQLMLPAVNTYANSLINHKGNDEFTQFEKEPFKMMVVNELKKSEKKLSINDEVSMITNLQNIKQGLKSDYTDKDILNIILLNLNLTDQLIDEHLNLSKKQTSNKNCKLVERDSSSFRDFIQSTYFSKDVEDPFTNFFLKEAAKRERITKVWEEEKKQEEFDDLIRDRAKLEKTQQRKEIWQDKIDRMLLENELENEDMVNLSEALKTNVKVNYDLKTLIKTEYLYDIEPELLDQTLSADDFLDIKRRQAETKLIKTTIIYKLYQGHSDLSANEKTYLQHWINDLTENNNRNVLNLRDSMVPKKHSKLTIGDLEAKNLYTLNSIPRVQLDREKHRDFAVNDLVLELSHFLDEEVVNKVEMEVFQEKIKADWNLSSNFKLVETRNKEISLVINELEEVTWRIAGMVSDGELETIKKMVSIQRNLDLFDREFYDNDMKSMKEYVDKVNTYDNRISLIEQWIVRKEDEFKSRINRPPAHLKKTDQELFVQIDKPIRRARERLVSRLLSADEFGNKIEEKKYADLTGKELNLLTEGLCVRLYLFNYDYPPFLYQAMKGIMDHPNLPKSDRDMLDSYCKVFEVDWRGVKDTEQNKEFMYSNPIHIEGTNVNAYGVLDEEKVKEMLKRACVPFVEQVAAHMLSHK